MWKDEAEHAEYAAKDALERRESEMGAMGAGADELKLKIDVLQAALDESTAAEAGTRQMLDHTSQKLFDAQQRVMELEESLGSNVICPSLPVHTVSLPSDPFPVIAATRSRAALGRVSWCLRRAHS